MATLTCDHCGNFTANNEYGAVIMWCGLCIEEDYHLIDDVGLIHNGGKKAFFWSHKTSKDLLQTIPKKWKAQPPIDFKAVGEKLAEATWVPETKPCSRKYYGLPECTCGTCPPKRRPTNTNPFRYGF